MGNLFRRLVGALQRVVWWCAGRLGNGDKLWSLIDSTGIVVAVGPNGSGKSLAVVHSLARSTLRGQLFDCADLAHEHNAAVWDHWSTCLHCDEHRPTEEGLCPVGFEVLEETRRGWRLVYSTAPLLDDDGLPHSLYVPLVDYKQLTHLEHCDVFFDEVASVSDASSSASMPVQVIVWLTQLRKRDVRLRVTSPAYARCSLPIRQCTQVVLDCRSFFAERSETGRLWRPRKAMLFRAYDAFTFEEFRAHSGDKLRTMARCFFWRPGCEAQRRYSTLGAVEALTHVTEAGMCAVCGGSRSRPRCACPPELEDVPAADLRVVETVAAGGGRVRRAELLHDHDEDDER